MAGPLCHIDLRQAGCQRDKRGGIQAGYGLSRHERRCEPRQAGLDRAAVAELHCLRVDWARCYMGQVVWAHILELSEHTKIVRWEAAAWKQQLRIKP